MLLQQVAQLTGVGEFLQNIGSQLNAGKTKGRTSSDQITYSERGNLQGAQFYAVAGRVYELACKRRLGREIPTEWFLQDIRN